MHQTWLGDDDLVIADFDVKATPSVGHPRHLVF
jgi:hypothetical protein